ncbi:hypothetical protein B0J11DRAFT_426844, partial [Dendryphion nanum]
TSIATNPDGTIHIPTPIQTGMTPGCKMFHLVEAGEICSKILIRYRITMDLFARWNPAIGIECLELRAGTYPCVGVL